MQSSRVFLAAAAVLAACQSAPADRAPFARSEAQSAQAQAELVDHLTRIFEGREFSPKSYGPVAWLEGGAAYALLEPSDAGGSDLVRIECASGERSVLVPAARFVPDGAEGPLEVERFAFSKDERLLLVTANGRTGFRLSSAGDAYVLDLARPDARLKRLGGDAPEKPLQLVKLTPAGDAATYVRDNDLWIEDLATGVGVIERVTSGGSKTLIHGGSDWVYEEELDVTDGYRTSPDGKRIAFLEFDESGVGIFTLVNAMSDVYTKVQEIAYPKAGTANPAVRLGIVDTAGAATPRFVELPGDPRDHLLARFDWVDDRRLIAQRLDRAQQHAWLYLVDAESGAVSEIRREDSKTWVEVVDELEWIEPGRTLLYSSEQDGWRRPVVVSLDGAPERPLTRGPIDAIRVLGADPAAGFAYFTASPDNATQAYFYRVRLDGTGTAERLSPAEEPGTHAYELSPDRRYAIHRYSSFEKPPVIDLVALDGRAPRVVRTLVDNRDLAAKAAPYLDPPAELFTLEIEDGVALDGWVIRPKGFDPSLAYPAIVYVYGEPAGQTVLDSWGGGRGERMMFHRALAGQGYVVVSFDNRGTPGPKGAAWRKVIYGGLGVLPTADQARAISAFAAERPWIDASRIGVWGRSGGGMNTLNLMFRHPEIYRVGVSVAPVSDHLYYDTIYTERYMGLPADNAIGYHDASPIHYAAGLAGDLLLVHGTGDDNVHAQNTEAVIDALVALKKPFDLMLYPNRTHQLREGTGTEVHFHALLARYFMERLPAGGRPR